MEEDKMREVTKFSNLSSDSLQDLINIGIQTQCAILGPDAHKFSEWEMICHDDTELAKEWYYRVLAIIRNGNHPVAVLGDDLMEYLVSGWHAFAHDWVTYSNCADMVRNAIAEYESEKYAE